MPKLDYLSKYYMDDPAEGGSSKKKKKKQKKKHKKGKHKQTLEPDEHYLPEIPSTPEDDDECDEDAPVVVAAAETAMDAQQQPVRLLHTSGRGRWSTEPVTQQSLPEKTDQGPRRQRHDSSELDEAPPRRQRHGSPSDDSQPDARRHNHSLDDASGKDNDTKPKHRRHRHDSSDLESDNMPQRRRRHDSSDDDSDNEDTPRPRKRRHDSSDDDDSNNDNDKARMSSGHKAGLQTGADFSQKETRIQGKRHKQAQEMVDKYGMGETVYRNTNDTAKNKTKQLTKEQQRRLNTGRAQLEQQQRAKREFEHIQQSTFARTKDDAQLQDYYKSQIRTDDPMAKFLPATTTNSPHSTTTTNSSQRPLYKGPPPKPNRFGIPPGHRWDARDRGNGFEDQLLAQRYSAQHQREQSYRHRAADM